MRYRKMLDNLLGQKTKIKLLRYLWKQDIAQSGRKIAQESGINHWQCNKNLKELYTEGVLTMQKAGNMHLYSLRKENYVADKIIIPLFKAESDLFQDLINELKSLKLQGILSIILFGSIVKTKEKPHSDIDILVIIENGANKKKILQEINKRNKHFLSYYGNALSPYIITSAEFKKRQKKGDVLLKNVIRDGFVVYGKSIGEIITD